MCIHGNDSNFGVASKVLDVKRQNHKKEKKTLWLEINTKDFISRNKYSGIEFFLAQTSEKTSFRH